MRPSPFRDISLAQLSYFVAAAEWGSMTIAASELYVAQSAVSTSIANLEQALGVQLLVRRRAKGLQLTAAGSEFLGRARRILASVDDAMLAVRPESTAGRVSVGSFVTLTPFYLPQIVHDLQQSHPEMQIDLSEHTAELINESLVDQRIEVALTYNLGLGPEIHQEVLATVPLYAAVAIDHPLAGRREVTLAELADEQMVLLDLPISRDYFLRVFSDHGLRPSVRYRFGSFEAVRAMVAKGQGFALLNQQPKLGYTYEGTSLHRLDIVEDVPGLEIVLASAMETEALSRRAQLFVEQCRRQFSTPL